MTSDGLPHQVHAIAAGHEHSILIDDKGVARAFGAGGSGRLGTGLDSDEPRPVALASLRGIPIACAAAGAAHSAFVDMDGRLFTCGANASGELGLGDRVARHWPTLVPFTAFERQRVMAVHTGGQLTLCQLADGRLVALTAAEGSAMVCLYPSGQLGADEQPKMSALRMIAASCSFDGHAIAVLFEETRAVDPILEGGAFGPRRVEHLHACPHPVVSSLVAAAVSASTAAASTSPTASLNSPATPHKIALLQSPATQRGTPQPLPVPVAVNTSTSNLPPAPPAPPALPMTPPAPVGRGRLSASLLEGYFESPRPSPPSPPPPPVAPPVAPPPPPPVAPPVAPIVAPPVAASAIRGSRANEGAEGDNGDEDDEDDEDELALWDSSRTLKEGLLQLELGWLRGTRPCWVQLWRTDLRLLEAIPPSGGEHQHWSCGGLFRRVPLAHVDAFAVIGGSRLRVRLRDGSELVFATASSAEAERWRRAMHKARGATPRRAFLQDAIGEVLATHGAATAAEQARWLCLAASWGETDEVCALLRAGASVGGSQQRYRRTPLHYASLNGHTGTVVALLAAKAEPNALDADGTSALEAALELGHTPCARVLAAAGSVLTPRAEELALNSGRSLGRLLASLRAAQWQATRGTSLLGAPTSPLKSPRAALNASKRLEEEQQRAAKAWRATVDAAPPSPPQQLSLGSPSGMQPEPPVLPPPTAPEWTIPTALSSMQVLTTARSLRRWPSSAPNGRSPQPQRCASFASWAFRRSCGSAPGRCCSLCERHSNRLPPSTGCYARRPTSAEPRVHTSEQPHGLGRALQREASMLPVLLVRTARTARQARQVRPARRPRRARRRIPTRCEARGSLKRTSAEPFRRCSSLRREGRCALC